MRQKLARRKNEWGLRAAKKSSVGRSKRRGRGKRHASGGRGREIAGDGGKGGY